MTPDTQMGVKMIEFFLWILFFALIGFLIYNLIYKLLNWVLEKTYDKLIMSQDVRGVTKEAQDIIDEKDKPRTTIYARDDEKTDR